MAHMGRSLGAVIVGWGTGFVVAVALGSTHGGNPHLGSTLLGWAVAGGVVIGLLLLVNGMSRPRAQRHPAIAQPRRVGRQTAANSASTVKAVEERAAARVAELEALLARHEEELAATAASLAATDLAGAVQAVDLEEPPAGDAATELEPALRQEVVNTLAELVGHTETGDTALLAGELASLLDRAR
jgi:hypothetical protein